MHLFLLALPLLPLAAAVEYTPFDQATLSKDSFFEQFLASDLLSSGWIPSHAKKIDGSPYKGKWDIRESHKYPVFPGEKGLVMVSEADFFSISKVLPFELAANGQDVVLQYEVKFQNGVTCGGAYLKLLSDSDPASFSDASRYEIMFGPDICGSDNRVQFLTKRETTDISEDSKLRTPPMAKNDALTALYTLIIRANKDMEVRINGGVAKAGNLLNTPNLVVPPISVPEYIPDLDAQKPENWDDRPVIIDESVEKPADYDRLYNSMWVADPAAKKPEGWNDDENEPAKVPNPDALRPEEWIDEEDGEWKAPLISNPNCRHGCGKWEAPQVVNTAYKGAWVAPVKENPNYQGEWKRPLKINPEYGQDSNIGLRPINGIGIDVWSMQSGVMFSNIYLGHSVEEAERIGNATFKVKWDLEYDSYKKTKPRAKHEPRTPPKSFDDLIDEKNSIFSAVKSPFLSEWNTANAVWAQFQADPVSVMTTHPIRFAFYCFLFVVAFTLVFGLANVALFLYLSSGDARRENERKSKALKKKEEAEEITEEELVAQIKGKTTGASVSSSNSRKIR